MCRCPDTPRSHCAPLPCLPAWGVFIATFKTISGWFSSLLSTLQPSTSPPPKNPGVCVKGSRTLIESSLVFGFNRISDRQWGGMECGGLLVWFIFRLADGGIWRWRVEAGSEVKCYQFIWSLLALLENLQRSWTHYSNVTWPCRASSGVWGTESSWLRPWIAAAWTQPVTVYSHAPPLSFQSYQNI